MSNQTPVLGKLMPMLPAGKNMRAAVAFYAQTLGFTPTYTSEDANTVIVERGAVAIMLQNFDDPHIAEQTTLRIETANVAALYAEYQARGLPSLEENAGAGLGTLHNTFQHTREFSVSDLAGVCLIFYEALEA